MNRPSKPQKTASFHHQLTRLTTPWHRARVLLEEQRRLNFLCPGTMRGQSQTISQRVSESFEDALTRVGHKVEHHHYPNSEHFDLPMRYGKGGASDISSKVESFLASVK